MMLCSCCDSGWHLSCLQQPLLAVLEGDWLCAACTAAETVSGGPGSISRSAPVRITIAGQPVAWVKQFKYLGSQFSADGSLDAELQHRMKQAEHAFSRLWKPVWRHKGVSVRTKMRIYRCMVGSVLLYGAHSWAPTDKQLARLEVKQQSQLRRILGRSAWKVPPGSSNSGPRLISNQQLLSVCEQPTIAERLACLQGRWVGHLLRMPEHRLARQLFFGSLQTTAPPQTPAPRCTLIARYCALAHKAYPSHVLRKYDRDFLRAAAIKAEWIKHFS